MSDLPLSEALAAETLRKAMRQYAASRNEAHLAQLLDELADPKRLLFYPLSNWGPMAHRKLRSLRHTEQGLELHVYSGMGIPERYAEDAVTWAHVSVLIADMRSWGGGTIVIDDGTPGALCIWITETGEQLVCAQAHLHEQMQAWRATLN